MTPISALDLKMKSILRCYTMIAIICISSCGDHPISSTIFNNIARRELGLPLIEPTMELKEGDTSTILSNENRQMVTFEDRANAMHAGHVVHVSKDINLENGVLTFEQDFYIKFALNELSADSLLVITTRYDRDFRIECPWKFELEVRDHGGHITIAMARLLLRRWEIKFDGLEGWIDYMHRSNPERLEMLVEKSYLLDQF